MEQIRYKIVNEVSKMHSGMGGKHDDFVELFVDDIAIIIEDTLENELS